LSAPFIAPDGRPRCGWCAATEQYLDYHDHEWGFPVADDRRLFEKLCLESFQAGLSWRTVLEKRENFRAERLLGNAGIIRHRGKIEAVIHNARRALELVEREGSLAAFLWRYEPDPASLPPPQSATTIPEAQALSKELRGRGWKFLGPTTVFAFMQAMGLVNDHAEGCALRPEAARARAAFTPPIRNA